MNEYERAIAALFARTGTTAKLGLERTNALLAQLGNPERRFPAFHVAGTNGKGSVVAMLDALLRDKGLRVGRYTSPHLVDFRERVVVDGVQIGEEEVLRFLRDWESESDRLGATFFELTTVLALEHFARAGVDVAVIETGMGGRLDATNVVIPVVTGITSVAMDHMEYLGDSIELIAREKAGILKRGVPAVVGDLPVEAMRAVERVAVEEGSPLLVASALFPVRTVTVTADGTDLELAPGGVAHRVRVGLVGAAQGSNASVALAMLHAAGEEYDVAMHDAARVLPGVKVPGRFQRIGKFIVDVAHNVEGMRALRATLEQVGLPRPVVAVVGILRDKQWDEMVRVLAPAVDRVILTSSASAPADRAWDLQEARRTLSADVDGLEVVPALRDALARAAESDGTVLVCGSFFTAGEALTVLGGGV